MDTQNLKREQKKKSRQKMICKFRTSCNAAEVLSSHDL